MLYANDIKSTFWRRAYVVLLLVVYLPVAAIVQMWLFAKAVFDDLLFSFRCLDDQMGELANEVKWLWSKDFDRTKVKPWEVEQ